MKKYLLMILIPLALVAVSAGWIAYQQRGQTAAGVIRSGELTAMAPSGGDVISREDTVQVLDVLAKDSARRGIWIYAITSAETRGGYLYASVAGFPGNQDINAPWTLDQATWLGSVTQASGASVGAVQGDSFGAQALQAFGTGGGGFILPFYHGTSAQYGVLGVHDCGFSMNGWKAVDLFPTTQQIYAAYDGEVSYVCRDGTQISYRVGDLMYVHMQDNGVQIGEQISQGQLLGSPVTGTFTATCGNASQTAGIGHVHFCFLPYDNAWSADGYTLSALSNNWTKGGTTYAPLSWLNATWESGDVIIDPPSSSAMGGNFWDSIVAVLSPSITDSVASLPDHQMVELSDRSTTILIPVLQLLWPFLSLFQLTWWAWALGIIAILETLRISFAVVMWGKKVLPDIIGWFI